MRHKDLKVTLPKPRRITGAEVPQEALGCPRGVPGVSLGVLEAAVKEVITERLSAPLSIEHL